MQKTLFLFNAVSIGFNKRLHYSCLLFISLCFLGHSQNNKFVKSEVYQSLDQAEIAKLRNYDFQENFAVLLRSDKSSNYFFVDLSKLPSPFAFKYFLYLVTQSGNRIQTGHGIDPNKAWFISDNKILETKTLKQILSFRQSATDKNNILSEKEKDDWIKVNNY